MEENDGISGIGRKLFVNNYLTTARNENIRDMVTFAAL
jgi:hypothetical protein